MVKNKIKLFLGILALISVMLSYYSSSIIFHSIQNIDKYQNVLRVNLWLCENDVKTRFFEQKVDGSIMNERDYAKNFLNVLRYNTLLTILNFILAFTLIWLIL